MMLITFFFASAPDIAATLIARGVHAARYIWRDIAAMRHAERRASAALRAPLVTPPCCFAPRCHARCCLRRFHLRVYATFTALIRTTSPNMMAHAMRFMSTALISYDDADAIHITRHASA